jgi:RNA polymerase sigma-70 factor (ECF subfamily)
LYRIVVNLCIDQNRRRPLATLNEHFNLVDPSRCVDEVIELEERDNVLAHALNDLPVRQRAAVTLVYDEGLSASQAAREIGVSAKAVERLLSRARLQLRSRLQSA